MIPVLEKPADGVIYVAWKSRGTCNGRILNGTVRWNMALKKIPQSKQNDQMCPELDFLPLIAVYRIKRWCFRHCEIERTREVLRDEIKALKTEIAKRVFVMRKFKKQKVPRYSDWQRNALSG